MTRELVVLVPVLNRPHRIEPLLTSIRQTTTDARVLFLCDEGDNAEIEALLHAGADFATRTGSYAHKINVGVEMTPEPYIFLGADDLNFQPGWFPAARAKLNMGFGAAGVNDKLRRTRDHATHFLLTREYAEQGCIDAPGPLCEEYDHSFVDDEFIATAKKRGAYAYAPDSVVEHIHWMNGRAEDDDVYRKGRARFRLDRKTFERRKPLWT